MRVGTSHLTPDIGLATALDMMLGLDGVPQLLKSCKGGHRGLSLRVPEGLSGTFRALEFVLLRSSGSVVLFAKTSEKHLSASAF